MEIQKVGRGLTKLRSFRFKWLAEIPKHFSRNERIIFVALIVILGFTLAINANRFYKHHTVEVPARGSKYIEGLVGEPRYINPLLAQSQTDKDLTRLIFAGLYKYDTEGKLIPDLADGDIQFSPDGKQYTVKLKQNLRWHDGQPLNADDVVFTIQLLQSPDFKSPYRSLWQNIQIQRIDDLTVKFVNPNVSAPFINNLTLGILPKHVWSTVSAEDFQFSKINLEPIGSGAFLAKEINKLSNGSISSINLQSYSNYWAGKPYLDEIELKFFRNNDELLYALQTKNIMGLGFVPIDKKIFVDEKNTKQTVTKISIFEYQALFFNLDKNRALQDKNVRQALTQSVDRDLFINNVFGGLGKPALTPILEGQIGFDANASSINSLDINLANSILDKAGWARDPQTGIRSKGKDQLAFTITTNDFILNSKSADELKEQWKKIGANVSVQIVASADIEKNVIRPRNFESLLFSESTGIDPDPFVFWHSSQANNPGVNLAQYKNTTVDRLIVDARNTFDTNARAEKYTQFQQIFSLDIPAIILDQSMFVYEMNPQVKGVKIKVLSNPEDRFYDAVNWYIQTSRSWK